MVEYKGRSADPDGAGDVGAGRSTNDGRSAARRGSGANSKGTGAPASKFKILAMAGSPASVPFPRATSDPVIEAAALAGVTLPSEDGMAITTW